MKVDILYLAWNRAEFVRHTFPWLLAHTDWRLVGKLVVYDDGSEDGTLEYLREAIKEVRVPAELRLSDLRSPPAVMNHYLATSEAQWFAKVDSDIALPGLWLPRLLGVVSSNPQVELLGMEAGMVRMPGRDGAPRASGPYRFEPASHIGGVGLMRVEAFRSRPRIPERGRFGFTEWQDRYQPVRGWIDPDLLCPQLDRLPLEPFRSLSEAYCEQGWQRAWEPYDEKWMAPYWEWLLPAEAAA